MKKLLPFLLIILVVLIVLVVLIYPTDTPPGEYLPPQTSEVELAPDFTLTDLNGNEITLSQFRGDKNIFLNFWATTCGYCRQEMPDIDEIYHEYKDKDLVVLTVNVGENQRTVQSYIEANKFSFPVLLDTEQKVSRQYKVSSIPVSYFINKEGKIMAQRIGLLTKEQMLSYIYKL